MMAGIDNLGYLYYTLIYANSNNTTIELFLFNLVRLLDRENVSWRKDTIILLDGAVWHTSENSLILYETLNIPVIISEPYSYDGSPIELFFACLKRSKLNPDNLPMSRSK